MDSFHSGPSIKLYGKLRNWFNFDKDNVLQVYSGKIDIGQHISSTLALISSKITGIDYDQVEIIKLDTDISPNEGKTASSLSVPDSGSAIKAASLSLRKAFMKYSLKTLNVNFEDIVFDNGIKKSIKNLQVLAPSNFADSKSSSGIVL